MGPFGGKEKSDYLFCDFIKIFLDFQGHAPVGKKTRRRGSRGTAGYAACSGCCSCQNG